MHARGGLGVQRTKVFHVPCASDASTFEDDSFVVLIDYSLAVDTKHCASSALLKGSL